MDGRTDRHKVWNSYLDINFLLVFKWLQPSLLPFISSFCLQKDIRCFVSLLPFNLSYFRFFKQNGLFPLPSSLPFISSFRLWNDIRYFASSKSHLSVLLLVKVAVERAHAKNSGSNSSRMGGSMRCAIAHCFFLCTMASTCLRHASWRLTMAGFESYCPKTKAQNFAPVGAISFLIQNFQNLANDP